MKVGDKVHIEFLIAAITESTNGKDYLLETWLNENTQVKLPAVKEDVLIKINKKTK